MKLLIFSPYYPPHTGGLESHSDEFNHHLAEAGIQITVFTPRLPTSAPVTEVRYAHVNILRFPACELIPNYPIPIFWQREFWDLWKRLQTEEFSLVVSRTRFFFTSLMAWYYAKKVSRPWAHIEHGSDFASFNGTLKTLFGKLYDYTIGAFVLRHSHVNIANSQASAAFVHKLSGRADCNVIYRGIEKATIETVVPHSYFKQHFPGKIIIGFIGRLIDGKGIMDLLEAFSQLSSPQSICCLIGDGPERQHIETFIRDKKISKQVILLGDQPFREAMALLKSFDIFVNPSYTEGIPTAVIEAALSRKAIIATNVGGTPEIITGQGDGFLIDAHDSVTLHDKLHQLINDRALRISLGEGAYLSIKDKFSWEHSVRKYLALFNRVLTK